MKKYEKPAVTVMELKTEVMLRITSNIVLPDDDDDYADIESGIILPGDMVWD